MDVSCTEDPELEGATLVRPSGTLDAPGANGFLAEVGPHVTDARPSVLVDMSGVDLMSSAGIGTLIRLLNDVQTAGGRLALFGCSERVRNVFRITALESALGV